MSDATAVPRRRAVIAGWLLLVLSLPWTAPGLALKGLDGVLRGIDSRTERGPVPPLTYCGTEMSDNFDVGASFVRSVLHGEGIDYSWARTLDMAKSYNSARCEAMERWLHNREFPTLAAMQAPVAMAAPKMSLIEQDGSNGQIRNEYVAYGFVSVGPDGIAVLRLDRSGNELQQIIVDKITAAMPEFGDPLIRGQIAALVGEYPQTCLDIEGGQGFDMAITVGPVEGLGWFTRRSDENLQVTNVSIGACLEKSPPECIYTRRPDDRGGFTFLMLKELLTQCRLVTEEGIKQGLPYDGWVEDARLKYPVN